jgi:serine/threonine-protein kinase HipA
MDYSEKEQLFRRMVFNVLALNHDDHTKNFSFIYKNNKWKLAPAYDLTFSYNPDNYWLKNHNININGKNNNITKEDILEVGKKFGIKKAEQILLDINEVVLNFKHYANKYKLPKEKTTAISLALRC